MDYAQESRFDAIAVVESCYALDQDSQAWLERLATLARPSLGGFATFAVQFELQNGAPAPLGIACAGGYSEARSRELFEASVRGAPSDAMAQLMRQARVHPVASFSGLMAPFGHTYQSMLEQAATDEFPLRDHVSVYAWEAGIYLTGLHDRRTTPTAAQQRTWARLVPHVDAGARLRASLATYEEAVMTPDGRCLHAAGAARSTSARERLREAARAVNRARGPLRATDPAAALESWTALIAGRWSLVDRFESDGRRLVIAVRNPPTVTDPRALTERERQVVHLAAEGASNKIIAYTLGITESGVGTHIGRALRKLGLSRRLELAPAMRALTMDAQIGSSEIAIGSAALHVQDERLSLAEREVVDGVLRGLSNREIAAARGTSERTIANQLGAVFRKLGVCSRGELMTLAS